MTPERSAAHSTEAPPGTVHVPTHTEHPDEVRWQPICGSCFKTWLEMPSSIGAPTAPLPYTSAPRGRMDPGYFPLGTTASVLIPNITSSSSDCSSACTLGRNTPVRALGSPSANALLTGITAASGWNRIPERDRRSNLRSPMLWG